jgi:hypothetical protein
MTGAPVQSDMTVIVRGGVIAQVGRNLAIPAGATVIDGRGRWMMPGLVDAHMHLTNIRALDEQLLAVALANGVTSEIELGGSNQPDPTARLRIRDDVSAGRVLGPTLYVAAPKINDAELSHAAGMQLVDEYRAQGYDLIKVYNRLSLPGYRGILLRASQTGIPVVGHVVRAVGLEGTLLFPLRSCATLSRRLGAGGKSLRTQFRHAQPLAQLARRCALPGGPH